MYLNTCIKWALRQQKYYSHIAPNSPKKHEMHKQVCVMQWISVSLIDKIFDG